MHNTQINASPYACALCFILRAASTVVYVKAVLGLADDMDCLECTQHCLQRAE